jgi:hypothetical protein
VVENLHGLRPGFSCDSLNLPGGAEGLRPRTRTRPTRRADADS